MEKPSMCVGARLRSPLIRPRSQHKVAAASDASSSLSSSSATLSPLTHGACRASGPAAPPPRPRRPAAPCPFSGRAAGVSGSHRKPDGGLVLWHRVLKRFYVAVAAAEEILFCEEGIFFPVARGGLGCLNEFTKAFPEREKFSSRSGRDH